MARRLCDTHAAKYLQDMVDKEMSARIVHPRFESRNMQNALIISLNLPHDCGHTFGFW